jgi:hypothetical protein
MQYPYDHEPDDSRCACCNANIGNNPQPDTWQYEGFCDAVCAARHVIDKQAKFADDHIHGNTRNTLKRAMSELVEGYNHLYLTNK